MRIKKKDCDSKAWPQKPTALLVSKTVASKQSHDAEKDWPPLYHHDDDDESSGCSFSSAPSSYFSDYNEDDDDDEDDLKDIGEKDTKLPPSTTTIQPKEPQLSPYFFHMMPTNIHHAGTCPNSDGVPSNAHEADHDNNNNNNKDDKEGTYSNHNNNNSHNVTSDLFQMGSMLVVGLVGFLVVFAVGVAVGEHQHHRRDHDREDHSQYYWEAPRQITRHRRHFRDW